MANSHHTETPQLGYTLVIEPADCDYHDSTAGLIYAVEALGDLLVALNPAGFPQTDADPYMPLYRFLQSALPLMASTLTARLEAGDNARNTVIDDRMLAALNAGVGQ